MKNASDNVKTGLLGAGKDSQQKKGEEAVRLQRRGVVVGIEVIGNMKGMMLWSLLIMSTLGGIAMDISIPLTSLSPSNTEQHPMLRKDNQTFLATIPWRPLMYVSMDTTDINLLKGFDVAARFTARAGSVNYAFEIADEICSSHTFNIPNSYTDHLRRGARVPYGGDVDVRVTFDEDPMMPINATVHSVRRITYSIPSNIAYVSILVAIVLFVRFVWVCRKSKDPLDPAHYYIGALLILFPTYAQSVAAMTSLEGYKAHTMALAGYLLNTPFLFVYLLQGTLIGLHLSMRKQSRRTAIILVVWLVLTFPGSIVFYCRENNMVTVDDGVWNFRAYTGEAERHRGYLAMAYGYFFLTNGWIIGAIASHAKSRYVVRSLPYLESRGHILKMRAVGMTLVSTAIFQLSFLAHVIAPPPAGGATFGGVISYFGVVTFLSFAFSPVFKQNDNTKPPPPTDGSWKTTKWHPSWHEWATTTAGAYELYYFVRGDEEQAFWELQQSAEDDEQSHPSPRYRSSGERNEYHFVVMCFVFSLRGIVVGLFSAASLMVAPFMFVRVGRLWWFLAHTQAKALFEIPRRRDIEFKAAEPPERWCDMFCSGHTWGCLAFLLLEPFLSGMLLFLSGIAFAVAIIPSLFFRNMRTWDCVTFPTDATVYLYRRIAGGLLGCLVAGGYVGIETVPPSARFTPFCLETCITLSHIAYETYRTCPGDDESGELEGDLEPAMKKTLGWIPQSGLASANVSGPRGKVKNRPIDVKQYGLELRAILVVDGMQVLVVFCPKTSHLLLAFRGTSNTRNKVADLNILREPWDEIMEEEDNDDNSPDAPPSPWLCGCCTTVPLAHRGFTGLWNRIRSTVHSAVAKHGEGAARISITGHSLGASMAILCAYSLARKLRSDRINLYTFGAPLIGNLSFAKRVRAMVPCHFHVVNENDAITRAAGTWGNVHAGKEVRVGRCGQLLVSPTTMERCQSLWGRDGNPFAAHKLVRYQAALSFYVTLLGEASLQVRVGEEDSTTDTYAWAEGPRIGGSKRFRFGAQVASLGMNGKLGRVAGYHMGMVRVRFHDLPPYDIPELSLVRPTQQLPVPSNPAPTAPFAHLPPAFNPHVGPAPCPSPPLPPFVTDGSAEPNPAFSGVDIVRMPLQGPQAVTLDRKLLFTPSAPAPAVVVGPELSDSPPCMALPCNQSAQEEAPTPPESPTASVKASNEI